MNFSTIDKDDKSSTFSDSSVDAAPDKTPCIAIEQEDYTDEKAHVLQGRKKKKKKKKKKKQPSRMTTIDQLVNFESAIAENINMVLEKYRNN